MDERRLQELAAVTAHIWSTALLHIIVLPECCLKNQPNLVLQHFYVVRCKVQDAMYRTMTAAM